MENLENNLKSIQHLDLCFLHLDNQQHNINIGYSKKEDINRGLTVVDNITVIPKGYKF